MARGHKFAKLKTANHQKLAIRQNLAPPNLPAIRYEITWMDSNGIKPSDSVIANVENTQFKSQHGSPPTSPAVQSNFIIASVKVTESGLYTCAMSGTGLRDTILLIVYREVTQIELEY